MATLERLVKSLESLKLLQLSQSLSEETSIRYMDNLHIETINERSEPELSPTLSGSQNLFPRASNVKISEPL